MSNPYRYMDMKHYNWVPGCNGTEQEFVGADGKTYIWMWNSCVGEGSEHAYYCKEDDLFLEYDQCHGRVWPSKVPRADELCALPRRLKAPE